MGKISLLLLVFMSRTVLVSAYDTVRTSDLLALYLQSDTSYKPETIRFTYFLDQLQKRENSFKKRQDFVEHIFLKTHQKFLKNYSTHASFGETLARGNYNCLTGTALYALILNHFHIEHTIIETNYHIFIVAKINNENILMEATDPLSGFVAKPSEVAKRMEEYKNNTFQPVSASNRSVHYKFSFSLWQNVSIEGLQGLLFFNKAVQAYNNQQLKTCIAYLSHAGVHRPSERIQEFSAIVMMSVANSEFSASEKDTLIRQLRNIRKQSAQWVTASLGQ
jgi:hypothetical protein